MGRVLVCDDDAVAQKLLRLLLEGAGHEVAAASDGPEALRAAYATPPDVVLLDVMLPTMDGWTVLSRLRELTDVPVLMLTAMGGEMDRVRGLRAGADDYVVKPFGRQELLARVDALLRRRAAAAERPAPEVHADERLTVDLGRQIVEADGQELRLTPLEFRLIAALVKHAGAVLSPDQLAELVWDDHFTTRDQVKLLVARLRKKLAPAGLDSCVETVRGFGYRYRRGG